MPEFETIVPMPNRMIAHYGVSSLNVKADGSAIVLGHDGQTKANITSECIPSIGSANKAKKSFKVELARLDAAAVQINYSIERAATGHLIVEGQIDGKPIMVEISGYSQRLLKSTVPELDPEDRKILAAISYALEARANLHGRAGCALAGIEVIVSAVMLHPIGVGFGFVAMLIEC